MASPSDEALSRALRQRDAGDLFGAIDVLRAAASADLSDPVLALNLAKMLAESGQVERAETWFRHALKLAPDDLDVRLSYGTFLGQAGHPEAAREHLQGVITDLENALAHASAFGDHDAILEIHRFLGAASVNLGRAALECGDPATAIAFSRDWLQDDEHGDAAKALVADALDSDRLDPHHLAELSLDEGRVTPAIVMVLIDSALAQVPPDLVAVERAATLADDSLPGDWSHDHEPLTRALDTARALIGRAIMRGEHDARDFPTLLAIR